MRGRENKRARIIEGITACIAGLVIVAAGGPGNEESSRLVTTPY